MRTQPAFKFRLDLRLGRDAVAALCLDHVHKRPLRIIHQAPLRVGHVREAVGHVARIGALPFEILRRFSPADVRLAPEDRICRTMLEMLNTEGVVLEPAGALAVDVLQDLDDIAGKTIVCVCSGGNFDFERLPEVKERAQRYSGVKKYFVLRMPQRPGALPKLRSRPRTRCAWQRHEWRGTHRTRLLTWHPVCRVRPYQRAARPRWRSSLPQGGQWAA